jgi:UPF0755 protein
MKKIGIIILCLIILLGIFLFYPQKPSFYQEKTILIEKGASAIEVTLQLKTQGIIGNSYAFLSKIIITNNLKNIQAGQYSLNSNMTTDEIIDILINGKTTKNTITIIEGWDNKEIGEYLEEKQLFKEEDVINYNTSDFEFLKDRPNGLGLEGYLFPDTYLIEKNESLEDTMKMILENFDKKLTPNLREEITKQDKTIFEIITMASLIEKEVITYNDKQIVSGILWKRIEAGMPLQVDATVLYALEQNKEVSILDTKIDSPYNTYKYRGLPLGPICNPGLESIKAAIYPIETNYWYYLSKPNKETVFSRTLEEHNIAIAKYLK